MSKEPEDKSIELYEQLIHAYKKFVKNNLEVSLEIVLNGLVIAFARMLTDRQCALFDIDGNSKKRIDLFELLSKRIIEIVAEIDVFLQIEKEDKP